MYTVLIRLNDSFLVNNVVYTFKKGVWKATTDERENVIKRMRELVYFSCEGGLFTTNN